MPLSTEVRAADTVVVTDIAGRMVEVPLRPKRVVLIDGFLVNALNVILPDPVSPLVAWTRTFKTVDPSTYGLFKARFPAIDAVQVIGDISAAGASLESVAVLRPDLVVLPRSALATPSLLERLAAFRIPVIVADLFSDPLNDTVPTVRMFGRIFGAEDRSEAFARFYETRVSRLRGRLAPDEARPKTLVQSHAGAWKCCWSPGRASLGAFITLAGGDNIGAGPLPAQGGWLSREYIVAQSPAAYVATGRPENAAQGGLAIGPGIGPEEARAALAHLATASDLRTIEAVKTRRVYGLWNFFLDHPANILAAEVLAGWLHPGRAKDIDPAASLAELNTLLTVPLIGTYWIELGRSSDAR